MWFLREVKIKPKMGFGAKNRSISRAIAEMLVFVLLLLERERHFNGEAKQKQKKKLCQISSKKTNHLHHHVETKRGDVRRKSARQQQQNENVETCNDRRAEERDGCVFFCLSPLLSSTVSSSREMKGNRSFDFGFLPSVRTMLCRVTDVVFFLSLFQTRSSLINLLLYFQLEAKAA